MKCYIVVFGEEWMDDSVFTDSRKATQRLKELKDEHRKYAERNGDDSYDHWYELRELKLVEEQG